MVTLEELVRVRLVGVREELNRRLLTPNYGALTQETGDGPKSLVLGYLSMQSTVLGENTAFINQLIKSVRHILDSEPSSLDGFLEKYYNFGIGGIEKFGNVTEGIAESNLMSLESRFLADAGNAAKALFNITGDNSWAKRWYDSYKQSANMTEESEPRHSAHAYRFAGNAANALSKSTRNNLWTKNAIECYEKFLSYYEQNQDPSIKGLINRIKGNVIFLQRFV